MNTTNQESGSDDAGCWPAVMAGVLIVILIGLFSQSCETDDPYVPSSRSSGCARAAQASAAQGHDYSSEYSACRQLEIIIGEG